MTLPITTSTLTAAASNQVPNMVLASALNIAALQTLFDNAAEMYTYVQTFAAPGAIGTSNLADLAVTTAKIAALAVTTAKIALLAVDTAQIAALAVTNAKVAPGIDAVKLADGSVSNAEFQYLGNVTSDLQAQLNARQPLDSTLTALAAFNTNGLLKQTSADTFVAVTAPTGAVVGDSDTQTLTNKFIAASQITSQLAVANGGTGAATLTGIVKGNGTGAFTAVTAPSGAIVGTSDSQTLTNKSIVATQLTGTLPDAQFPALTGDLTTVAGAVATTLKNTGTTGTYKSVTTDAQGRVTSGTNPTTLAGFGITDAAPLTHVGAGGTSQHPVASAVLEGFMSIADKAKLDGLVQTGLAGYTIPIDTYITFGGRFKVGYNSTTDTLDTYET